jgi:cation transport regulator
VPYRNSSDLPKAVREHLPVHAQRIYMKAFNSAWEQYADLKKRREGASREETAHRVAWAAVEHSYEKGIDGQWHRKPQSK